MLCIHYLLIKRKKLSGRPNNLLHSATLEIPSKLIFYLNKSCPCILLEKIGNTIILR